MKNPTTALDLIQPADDTAAEKLATLTRVAGLEDSIKARKDAIRDALEEQVVALSAAAGGQFTLRTPDGTALIQGGNLKPRVEDRPAFARWLETVDADLVAWTPRVEVRDHAAAAEALTQEGGDYAEILGRLDAALDVIDEPLFDPEILDRLVKDRQIYLTEDGAYPVEDGVVGEDPIPGLAVSTSRETLVVKPAKDARAAARDVVDALFDARTLQEA